MDDTRYAGASCNKEAAHARAVSLMVEDFFWVPVLDHLPFGSDEASDGYYRWREWREKNPQASATQAVHDILQDGGQDYLNLPKAENVLDAFRSSNFFHGWDFWTLNVSVYTTVLYQLLDEGVIDQASKPYAFAATAIERRPDIRKPGFMPAEVLDAIDRVVAAA